MKQLDLFASPKPTRGGINRLLDEALAKRDGSDERVLIGSLKAVEKRGLVNGMSKAQLRRYAPAKLPRVTIYD